MATLTRNFFAPRVQIGECTLSNVQCEWTEYAECETIEGIPGQVLYEVKGHHGRIDFEWVAQNFPDELRSYFDSDEQVAVAIFVDEEDGFGVTGKLFSIALPQQEDVNCPPGKIDLSFSPKCQATIVYHK